jgi:hypothetical protein
MENRTLYNMDARKNAISFLKAAGNQAKKRGERRLFRKPSKLS